MTIKHFIFTGMPGSGKTSVLHALAQQGIAVVHEAATDVIHAQQSQGIAAPWEQPGFVEEVLRVQLSRQQTCGDTLAAAPLHGLQFFDRSPLCTYALAQYLALSNQQPFHPSTKLVEAIAEMQQSHFYCKTVFLFAGLGVIEPTAARRLSYDQALVFEQIHREVYATFGYTLVEVPSASVKARAKFVLNACTSIQSVSSSAAKK